ncbi:hypothetical protein [Bradymonas sediminis]|uniref:Uncharacterized protein n=1 Tax=Bradymonas sediminis TaxID=1548548 RepID=A0A2Z4FK50_9DELT|nr:hypothetical protein [Bradymonas sediminis]AWV89048.1 hypothetical protein DN745_06740 [Bradymonas sediminis]TDP64492.1 hypothetical protein DFR33_109153 [Bradymonas sediminis]
MPAWLTWLVAMGILVLEGGFLAAFGIDGWSFQTAVLLTIFLALRRDFVSGCLILAALLVPIEWLAVAPSGYYSLSLVVVFFALQLVRGSIQSDWGLSQVLVATVAVLLQTVALWFFLVIMEPEAALGEALLWGGLHGAAAAAGLAWPLGALLTRFDRLVEPRSGRRVKGLS